MCHLELYILLIILICYYFKHNGEGEVCSKLPQMEQVKKTRNNFEIEF